MDDLDSELFHNSLDDEVEFVGCICPNDCFVDHIANEINDHCYSHELNKKDLRYVFSGNWDLYKQE